MNELPTSSKDYSLFRQIKGLVKKWFLSKKGLEFSRKYRKQLRERELSEFKNLEVTVPDSPVIF